MKGTLAALACAALIAPTPLAGARPIPHAIAASPMPVRLVLIVLDGARPDYFSVAGIPHIRALQRSGTTFRSAWAGILESVTPAGHASIATGTEPRRTGILGFGWPNAAGHWVSLYHEDSVRQGELDRLMRAARVPTIAGRVHAADPGARVVALGGYKFYANDSLAGPDADVVMYYADSPEGTFRPRFIPGHAPPPDVLSAPGVTAGTTWSHLRLGEGDHLAMQLAVAATRILRPRVTLITLPEFDMPLGHILGASRDPRDVRLLMRGFDRDLGQLQDALTAQGATGRTLFVITADHGFAPIDRSISESVLRSAVHRAGTEVVHAVFQTGAYLWLQDRTRATAAADSLAASLGRQVQSIYVRGASLSYARVVPRSTSWNPGLSAANHYLLRSFRGPREPDVAVFFKEGVAAHLAGRSPWLGDHGGADWESQHIPLVIAGPGVRPDAVSRDPVRIIDIAPTVLTLMGITPSGMEGIPAASAFEHPGPGMAPAWARIERRTAPLVSALANESTRERGNGP